MKLTRSSLKELIRQSIKEIDFKNQKAFDAYNKKHKMRKSTKVNIGGKETTAGSAERGGADDYAPDGGHYNAAQAVDDLEGAPKPGSSASPDDVMNATLGGEKIGDIIDNEDHPNYDKAMKYVLSFDPDDEKVVSGPGKGGGALPVGKKKLKHPSGQDQYGKIKGPKPGDDWNQDSVMSATIGDNKVGDILGYEDHPDYSKALKYIMQFDPDDEKVVSGPGQKEGVRESVSRKRTTVKEVKTWMRTLEENRYKKTYQSDCRRVAWLVNNNLSEDYESMPISMRKKWSKAAYGRERQLAREFVKHKRNEAKLKESIRKIVSRLIND